MILLDFSHENRESSHEVLVNPHPSIGIVARPKPLTSHHSEVTTVTRGRERKRPATVLVGQSRSLTRLARMFVHDAGPSR